ncbi:hypothetical protein [Acinetobacter larvae]|uniref:Uncharacterized protein n=1 Tax=Acinetobacter larvae TaxID=1789224 RepID=A0A1B2M3F2_9GAMM|nr:hypothetical protein [Acinetobacter larvae]AOA59704.1 hypothetical protein BFG52_16020 [Acinetobacter larvae]
MNGKVRNTRRYNFMSAASALLLWGSWSFYINVQQADYRVALTSALAQGLSSFVITLGITILIEKQFNFYQAPLSRLILPPLCTVFFTGACLITIHLLVATPSILKTVAPPLTVALFFAFFTNFKLYKQVQSNQ